ncbi:MAG: cyclic lactone autoinducer peptide [Tenericutes bacterium]|nr:cyclic lactone autoinducer peptide [Mycoplasmatota bacterium]
MKTLILSIIASFGAFVAATGTIGCVSIWFDEPKMPKCLIEK